MNDQEAKVPKAECHWKAIDIFLFSNGQEYSPPRKYHLTTEELNSWDATLNYLARSQYGSSHTCIELYTIDGRKIEGPLDLNDGMHYVAVVPPDAFVDTGYEKYLIKASRSWEKRQVKRTTDCKPQDVKKDCLKCACCPCPKISAASPQVDKGQLVGTCNNTELTTIKKSDENIAIESALIRPQRCSTPKLEPPNDQQPSPTPEAPTPHRPSIIRNFNKQSTGQHTSFAKTAQTPNKQLSKITKPVSKNKEVLPKKIVNRPTKINEHVNNVRAKRLIPHRPKSTSQPPPPTPVSSLVREPSTFEAAMSVLEESNSDKDVIAATASTKVCKSTSDLGFIEANTNKTNTVTGVDEIVSCYIVDKGTNKTAQTETEQQTNEQQIPNMNRPFYVSSKAKVIHTEQYTEHSQTNVEKSKISLGDYIAVINKGDAVNMNLNIEIQNGTTEPKTGSEETHFYDVRKISSIANIFKKYKSRSLPERLASVKSKSMQSVLSTNNESYTKVVIIQCSCCGTKSAVPRIDTVPVYKDENGFFVVVPGPTPTAEQGCACAKNLENDKSISSDKNILTELCTEDMAEPKSEVVYPCVPKDVGVVMTVMHCGLRSRRDSSQKNVSDTCMLSKQVCIDESQRDGDCAQREKVELIKCRSNSRTRLPCMTFDSSTQTEWCCILMQVKHHDDNHYSFHLPPLELVKYYSR